MFAARNGNPAAIKLLVAAGADVNAKESIRATTALMWAADEGHAAAVKALVELGADVSAKSGPAGLPRNYMAAAVNVERGRGGGQATPRREAAAGRTLDEQAEFERANGLPTSARAPGSGWRANLAGARTGRPRARPGGRGAAAAAAAAADDARPGRHHRRPGRRRERRPDAAGVRGPRRRHRVGEGAARRRRRREPDDRVRLDAVARGHQQPQLQARRRVCSSAARTRTSPTRAAGRRCTWRRTTATSKAATTRCRSRTWTTWSTSRSC